MVLAGLTGDRRQQVQRNDLIRIRVEHLQKELFDLRPLPSLKMPPGAIQKLADGDDRFSSTCAGRIARPYTSSRQLGVTGTCTDSRDADDMPTGERSTAPSPASVLAAIQPDIKTMGMPGPG